MRTANLADSECLLAALCVLRFGKPKELEAVVVGSSGPASTCTQRRRGVIADVRTWDDLSEMDATAWHVPLSRTL